MGQIWAKSFRPDKKPPLIVRQLASNQNVQYQKNWMSQTQDIGRIPIFGPKYYFQHKDHQWLVDIMVIYHNMQN